MHQELNRAVITVNFELSESAFFYFIRSKNEVDINRKTLQSKNLFSFVPAFLFLVNDSLVSLPVFLSVYETVCKPFNGYVSLHEILSGN